MRNIDSLLHVLVSTFLCERLPTRFYCGYILGESAAVATELRLQRHYNYTATFGHSAGIFMHYEHYGNICNGNCAENIPF